jgi:hypothetical protein
MIKQFAVCPRCQSSDIRSELMDWDAVLEVEKVQRVWRCLDCQTTFNAPEEIILTVEDEDIPLDPYENVPLLHPYEDADW